MNASEFNQLSKEEKKKVPFKQLPTLNKILTIIFLVIMIFVVIAIFRSCFGNSEPTESLTLKQRQIKEQFSAWDGSHIKFTQYIKTNMNDPESFEHVETKYIVNKDSSFLVIIEKFRGNNAFGGKVQNIMSAKVDMQGNIVEVISN